MIHIFKLNIALQLFINGFKYCLFLLKKGLNLASSFVNFGSFQMKKCSTNIIIPNERRWYAWDSNPGRQDGRTKANPLSYGGTQNIANLPPCSREVILDSQTTSLK